MEFKRRTRHEMNAKYSHPDEYIDDGLSKCCNKAMGTYPSPFRDLHVDGEHPRERDKARAILELRMYALSAAIREKENWHQKRLDETIIKKWKEELLEQQEDLPRERRLTADMIDYVLDELEGHARVANENHGLQLGCFERIWLSDSIVEDDLRASLLNAAGTLENDWHPRNNQQVLDLVHPSLFPVVYSKTCLRSTGRLMEAPTHTSDFVSEHFAWLPSDFNVSLDRKVTLSSPYINNLHPTRHRDIHKTICKLIQASLPLFEHVLSDLKNPLPPTRLKTELVYVRDFALPLDGSFEPQSDWGIPCIRGNSHWYKEPGDQMILPKLRGKYECPPDPPQPSVDLRGRRLQVIVKMANIVLTPQNPEYGGGSWHIEAMTNERIVATSIYYYDEQNITTSSLAFRTGISEPLYHYQEDSECTIALYGLDRASSLLQERNATVTKEGRMLCFPNVYQHKVSGFSLVDRSKPGHRKIIAFFLVDPGIKIPSAGTVAPQQSDWVMEALLDSRLGQLLPVELLQKIVEMTPGVMTLSEAKAFREELMDERVHNAKAAEERGEDEEWPKSQSLFGGTFNMCEH